MFSFLLASKLTNLHKDILKLAYDRLLEKEDLSFGEILLALYGCRPERIGLHRVRKLSKNQMLNICRLEPYEGFHFGTEVEREKYHFAQASASKAVAELVKRGFLITVKAQKLLWAKGQPRVEGIENFPMFKLTDAGEKIIIDRRPENRTTLRTLLTKST